LQQATNGNSGSGRNSKLISKRYRQESFAETAVESESDSEDFSRESVVPLSIFQQQIRRLEGSQQSCLQFDNFVSDSTRQDLNELRSLVADSKEAEEASPSLKKICFHDRVQGTHYRRWWYKKENIYHDLQKLCSLRGIELDFHGTVNITADKMTCQSLVALLKSLRSDLDVTSIFLQGHLTAETEASCLKSLKNMLKAQDRDWEQVQVYTGFDNNSNSQSGGDYSAWKTVMEKYMALFAQFYELYKIPIDFRHTARAA
jgi:hypothetical protein